MSTIASLTAELCDSDPAMAQVLETFAGIDRIYQESLRAMGLNRETEPEVRNSADVAVSFRPVDTKFRR